MNKTNRTYLTFYALLLFSSVPAQADAPAQMGEVRIHLIRLDGTRAAFADVEVILLDSRALFDPKRPRAHATADEEGVVRVTWAAGSWQFRIRVKGVGYGTTEKVEVAAGKTVDAPLPPLGAFATVNGAALDVENGEVVFLRADDEIAVKPNEQGHFIAEVPAGWWVIRVRQDGKFTERWSVVMSVKPAEAFLLTVFLYGNTPAAKPKVPDAPLISWATGTVRDDAGKPIAGATVYGAATYVAFSEGYAEAKAVTDETGKYDLKGLAGLSYFSAKLIAHKPGSVAARISISREYPASAVRDFTLSSHGGTFDVTLLDGDKPVPGAFVTLFMEGGDLPGSRSMSRLSDVVAIVYPMQKTDAAGVAHFEHLPPGRYQVIGAMNERAAHIIHWRFRISPKGPTVVAEGIVVGAEGLTTHQMSLSASKK